MTATTATTRAELLRFMRAERHATVSSVSPTGAPQAATVGVVVSEDFEIFFDTLGPTRQAWKGLIYVRVRPTWLRLSDYSRDPPRIVELDAAALETLR